MISQYSNSEIGSTHWFNSLMALIAHTGEYIENNGTSGISEDTLRIWGKDVNSRAREIMTWRESIVIQDKQNLIHTLEETLKKLKEE